MMPKKAIQQQRIRRWKFAKETWAAARRQRGLPATKQEQREREAKGV